MLKRIIQMMLLFTVCILLLPVNVEAKSKKSKTNNERLLTAIIYSEANGESYAGQKAVGIVVMNRVKSKDFPNNIKEVIYQRGQFTPATNGSLNNSLKLYDKQKKSKKFTKEMKSCQKAAKECLKGSKTIKIGKKKKNLKGFHYFSAYVYGAKLQIGGHQFK